MISSAMRDVLIEHLDGPAAILAPSGCTWNRTDAHDTARANRFRTMKALIERGMLRPDANMRPRLTHITTAGRAALAEALADWADALTRAGHKTTDRLYQRLTDSALSSQDATPSP
jgi:hypothetical protein